MRVVLKVWWEGFTVAETTTTTTGKKKLAALVDGHCFSVCVRITAGGVPTKKSLRTGMTQLSPGTVTTEEQVAT